MTILKKLSIFFYNGDFVIQLPLYLFLNQRKRKFGKSQVN